MRLQSTSFHFVITVAAPISLLSWISGSGFANFTATSHHVSEHCEFYEIVYELIDSCDLDAKISNPGVYML